MEFPFDVNCVLPYEVTICNGDCRILNHGQSTRVFAAEKLTVIIDAIGEASYRAQGLFGAVTTARKFRISDHRLYIIKKASDNNNHGSVVGILKVSTKHLYVYDSNGQVHECTPLCVLDFYVHESKQRLGYGKQLFDTMLAFEKCAPYELAIDRPSKKCLAFLNKHYHLSAPIHQMNNFVVYHAFFNRSPITANRKPSASGQREEWTPWLSSSERERRRPFTEENAYGRMNGNIFGGSRTTKNERSSFNSYTTSYSQHYNQTHPPTNNIIHSAPYMPRTNTQVFNENDLFLSLQRNKTTPIIDHRRTVETVLPAVKPESLTSVYTFPSLIKPSNNWREQKQQPSSVDSNSSAWRLFGVQRFMD